VYRDWVTPYLKKQITDKEKLEAELTLEELKEIDEQFATWKADKIVMEGVFDGKYGTPTNWELAQIEFEALKNGTIKALKKFGNRRFLEIPEEDWEEIVLRLEITITNEQQQKMVYLETLSNILTTVSNSFNPQTGTFMILENPVMSKLFNDIMETAGYSSVELEAARNSQQAVAPPVPAEQPDAVEVPEFSQTEEPAL
jgi:hypothetical protein